MLNNNTNTLLRKLLSYWKLTVEVLLVGFFLIYAGTHWSQICAILKRLSVPGVVVCMLIYSLGHLAAVCSTRTLLAGLGSPRSYLQLLDIYFRRLPAKYLPGGIWHAVGRGSDLVSDGIPMRTVGQMLGLEQALAIWWSGFLGFVLVGLTFGGRVASLSFAIAFFWVACSGVSWCCLRRSRHARLLSAAISPTICTVYIAGWTCLATAFSLYLWIGGMVQGSILRVSASYLVSWMIGALAFFSPQGVGVFEFAVSKAIGYSESVQADFFWFVGSYRLVVLMADLVVCGIWLAGRKLTPIFTQARGLQ